jgi:hypothetical protein
MKSLPLLGVIVAFLAGCAGNPANPDDARLSWNGSDYDTVVMQWGAPVRSTTLTDGREARTWVSDAPASGGGFFPSFGLFGGSGGVGMGVGGMAVGGGGGFTRCERTLIFRDGRVVDQTWQGDAHYCASFTRR